MTDVGFEILPADGCLTCQQLDEHRHKLQGILVQLETQVSVLDTTCECHCKAIEELEAENKDLRRKIEEASFH